MSQHRKLYYPFLVTPPPKVRGMCLASFRGFHPSHLPLLRLMQGSENISREFPLTNACGWVSPFYSIKTKHKHNGVEVEGKPRKASKFEFRIEREAKIFVPNVQ